MTSKEKILDRDAFVWIWLPGETDPVVCGRVAQLDNGDHVFVYGKSYLRNENAISIFPEELPLNAENHYPLKGLKLAGCLRDASPDAWGRRVILNRLTGRVDNVDLLTEIEYFLNSGSDRIGALDFQKSAEVYTPRESSEASLEELISAAKLVEKGVPLTEDLAKALYHGTALGGARPKALINDGETKYISKFSASGDVYSVVKAEFLSMRLANKIGLNVANVKLVVAAGKDVLLIERFDREYSQDGWKRKLLLSALTLFKLDEMLARYASYIELAEIIRLKFNEPSSTLKELFGRLVFNILCGNTDDHARNHAAFWDGEDYNLTPAYDICPQYRAGNKSSQAMTIYEDTDEASNLSLLENAIKSCAHFSLTEAEAVELIAKQLKAIGDNWGEVCRESAISEVDRALLENTIFLNPFIFEGESSSVEELRTLAEIVKKQMKSIV